MSYMSLHMFLGLHFGRKHPKSTLLPRFFTFHSKRFNVFHNINRFTIPRPFKQTASPGKHFWVGTNHCFGSRRRCPFQVRGALPRRTPRGRLGEVPQQFGTEVLRVIEIQMFRHIFCLQSFTFIYFKKYYEYKRNHGVQPIWLRMFNLFFGAIPMGVNTSQAMIFTC